MSVNPAEQLIEGRLVGEIRRTRNDLDQLKNKQRIGSSSLIAMYGSTGVTGAIVIAAGVKQTVTASAQLVGYCVINVSVAVYVDTDNNSAYLANYGASLSAGQRTVNFTVNLNNRIPFNPIDTGFPCTQYWQVAISNNDTVAHTVYVYVTGLFPVGAE